jgi:hypothetical protein
MSEEDFTADPAQDGPSAGGRTRDDHPDADRSRLSAAAREEQAPLGSHPEYDDVLDVAVQYTFPCSDPISIDSCCASAGRRSPFTEDTRAPGEGAEPQPTDTTIRPR